MDIFLEVDGAEQYVILEEKDFRQRSWNHFCWLFDSGLNKVFINSLLFLQVFTPGQKDKIAFQKSGTSFRTAFIIGQEQDTVGGTFSEKQIFQGYLTELNIWDRLLLEEDIISMATCQQFLKGNIFSWEETNLKLLGRARLDSLPDLLSLCQKNHLFMFPQKISLMESSVLCSSLGGSIVLPMSEKENNEVMKVFDEYVEQCADSSNIGIWIGLEKVPDNNDWSPIGNITDISGITFSPRNSIISVYDDSYNCIYMMNNGGWKSFQGCNLVTNSLAACTVCEFTQTPMLGLKGTCQTQNAPNWNYYLSRSNSTVYFFEGYKRDLIRNVNFGWSIEKRSGEVFARLTESGQYGPLGRNSWQLSKYGRNLCPRTDTKIQLTLSTCGLNQFTCNSGHCINIYRRCDDVKDCEDDSDEKNCEVVFVPENYKKEPTRRLDYSINNIYTKVTILKFDSIDKSGVLDITLTIQMRWRDPRLTYLNIMDEGQINGGYEKDISVEKQGDLWLPLDNIVQRNAVIGEVLLGKITFVRVIVGDNATAPVPANAVEGNREYFILIPSLA